MLRPLAPVAVVVDGAGQETLSGTGYEIEAGPTVQQFLRPSA